MIISNNIALRTIIARGILLAGIVYVVLYPSDIWSLISFQNNIGFLLITGITGLAWLAWRVIGKRPFPHTTLDLALFCGILAYLVTTAFSADPRRSLIVLPQILVPILVYYLIVDLLRSGWSETWFTQSIWLSSLPVILYGLLQLVIWYEMWHPIGGWADPVPSSTVRIASIFGHANILVGYLNLVLPLGLVAIARAGLTRAGLRYLFWAFFVFVLIFFTSSRGGWLATLVILAVLIVYGLATQRSRINSWVRSLRRHPVWMLILAVALLLVALVFARLGIWVLQHPTHGTMFNLNREYIWAPAVQAFREDPITGLGPYTYGSMFLNSESVPPTDPMPHAHSVLFNVLSETGLIGMAALAFLVFQVIKTFAVRWRTAPQAQRPILLGIAAALVGFGVHSQFDFLNGLPGFNILLAVLIAQFAAFPVQSQAERAQSNAFTSVIRIIKSNLNRHGNIFLTAAWLVCVGSLGWGLWVAAPYVEGLDAGSRGDWRKAADSLDQAALRDRQFAINWFQAGLAHGHLALAENGSLSNEGELSTAIHAYETGLSIDPSYSVDWANLAVLQWASGDQNQAIQTMERAVEIAPKAYNLQLNLGKMYESSGRLEKARECYIRALDIAPFLAEMTYFRDTLFRAEIFENWQSSRPIADSTPLSEGWEALKTKRLQEAVRLFEQAAQSRSPNAFLGLGLAYLETGRLSEAETEFHKALFFTESEVWVHLRAHLGLQRVAVLRGDQEESIREGETARAILNATTAFGPGGLNLSDVAGLYSLRGAFSNDLLPGFVKFYYSDEFLTGLEQLSASYRVTGNEEQAAQIKAAIKTVVDAEKLH